MGQENTISARLWAALDGYDIGSGFGRSCPSCEQEHEPGDRLFVITERPPKTDEWAVSSIVCAECGQRSLPNDERRPSVHQALVSAELAVAGMTLALDGESARLLDRSPANDASATRSDSDPQEFRTPGDASELDSIDYSDSDA